MLPSIIFNIPCITNGCVAVISEPHTFDLVKRFKDFANSVPNAYIKVIITSHESLDGEWILVNCIRDEVGGLTIRMCRSLEKRYGGGTYYIDDIECNVAAIIKRVRLHAIHHAEVSLGRCLFKFKKD